MNKAELIEAVTERIRKDKPYPTRKEVDVVVSTLLEVVQERVSVGDDVRLVGFGAFELRQRAARRGRNPKTGEEIDIPEHKVPVFVPGKTFKEMAKDF